MDNRRKTLGDLPESFAVERKENGVRPPFGMPPRGGATGVNSYGQNQATNFDQSSWGYITFVADIAPKKIQDFTLRSFLLIQNKALIGTMYIGFGYIPNVNNSLDLLPQTGYEPFRYPTNEIWVSASQDGVQGLLLYGTT